jgi:EpsI family protein
VNDYIIQNGSDKQVVLYWYQSQGRIIASEYSAKIYLVRDASMRNRTDGALVRVVSPVLQGDEGAALEKAKSFANELFPSLSEYIPN